jgi:hydroxymethylbilane synthase
MEEHITAIIPMEEMLPAVSQGAIGIACREGDAPMEVGHQVQLVGGGKT